MTTERASAWKQAGCGLEATSRCRRQKSAILSCHGAAKDTDDEVGIALYHAVGQACGCVHTPGHALGFPVYELTAIVRKLGVDNCAQAVLKRIGEYEAALARSQQEALSHPGPWASFLV